MGAGTVSLRQQFWDHSHPFLGLRNLLFFPSSGDDEMMHFWWHLEFYDQSRNSCLCVHSGMGGGSSGLGLESFCGGLIESGGLNSIGSEDLTLVIMLNSAGISACAFMSPPISVCRVAITTSCAERLLCTVEQQSAHIW